MGLIRKTPNQKIKILPKLKMNPAKVWALISLLFLFLSVFSWIVGDFSAKADIFENSTLIADSETEGEGGEEGERDVVEGSCDVAEEEGLSVICGVVKSARIENDGGYLTTGEPVENVTVAIFESNPESPTGKTIEGDLMHLFSSTTTNSEGQFRVKARELGPKEGNIYIAFLCGGRVAGLKRTQSSSDIPRLVTHVNCGSDKLSASIPPAKLNYVNRSGNFLTCLTNPLKNAIGGVLSWINVDSPQEVAFYNEPPVRISGWVTEENYDFRYLPKEKAKKVINMSDRNFLLNQGLDASDGAYWHKDCEIRYGNDATCSSANLGDDALTNNLLHYIPERPVDQAYRTKEIRFNFKQTGIDPISMYSYMKGVYGDVAKANIATQVQVEDNTDYSDVVSCKNLAASKQVIAEDEENLVNTKLTVSPGLGLSTPFECESRIENQDSDLDKAACKKESGGYLTWEEILNDQDLKDKYFRCDQLAIKGGIVHSDYFSEVTDDAGQWEGVRDVPFDLFKTEAANPFLTETNTIIPGEHSQKTLGVSGLSEEKNKLNVMDVPFSNSKSEEGKDEGGEEKTYGSSEIESFFNQDNGGEIVLWDIGAQNMPACSISVTSMLGKLENYVLDQVLDTEKRGLITNFFQGVEDHIISPVSGSANFSTGVSTLRDELLTKRFSNDYLDSVLRAGAKGEEVDLGDIKLLQKLAIVKGIIGDKETKSFGERDKITLLPKDLKIEYELNKENFEEKFPAYGSSEYPGSHEHYPWDAESKNRACDVYAGESGDDPYEVRTCKVTDCDVEVFTINPITGLPKLTYEDCNQTQIESCLIGDPARNVICKVKEAGPYDNVHALETAFEAYIRDGHDSDLNVEEPIGLDTLADESADLSNAFVSPYSGPVKEKKLATLDVEYSGNNSDYGKKGFDVPEPSGGVPEFMYTASAAPTGGAWGEMNDMYYHCNIEFMGEGSVGSNEVVMPTIEYQWDCPVIPVNTCSGDAWEEIEGMPSVSTVQPEALPAFMKLQTNYAQHPEVLEAYANGEEKTGIPCEVFAGIHFVEGGGSPNQGLEEGQPISPGELKQSVLNAAANLKAAADAEEKNKNIDDAELDDFETLVAALSMYNGSGNQQCWLGPSKNGCPIADTTYSKAGKCPPKWYAEDSMYALNWLDSRHRDMDLRFCSDEVPGDPCAYICDPPEIWQRPGAMTVATMLNAVSGSD